MNKEIGVSSTVLHKPEMIIFDYGHTLLYEPGFDFLKGERAVFGYIKENPRHMTPEAVCAYGNELFAEYFGQTLHWERGCLM